MAKCFTWTTSAAISLSLSLFSLLIYSTCFCRNSRRSENLPKSCGFKLQICLSILTILMTLAQTFSYIIGNDKLIGTAPGFVIFYGVGVSISWVIVMTLLIMEHRRICPRLYGKSHGFPLLLFWTVNFVLMNLPLTSIPSGSWWWSLER